MNDDIGEKRLALLQDAQNYSVGKLLRTSFTDDNHATLGSDVTGLMIDLSKVPYGEDAAAPPQSQPPAQPQPQPLAQPLAANPAAAGLPAAPARLSWRTRVAMLFGG